MEAYKYNNSTGLSCCLVCLSGNYTVEKYRSFWLPQKHHRDWAANFIAARPRITQKPQDAPGGIIKQSC
jgi:hypothetical protein